MSAQVFIALALFITVVARAGWQLSEDGIVRGDTDRKRIAFAFTGHSYADGGETILNELARHGGHGSFFVTGDFLTNAAFAPLIARIVKEGHYLGPHSDKHVLYCPWDGPKTNLVSRTEFRTDLRANLLKLQHAGVDLSTVKYFLPPFEYYNRDIVAWSHELGLTLVNYTDGTRANADYMGDADPHFISSQKIFDSIVKREIADPHGLNGYILLLHLGSGPARTDKFVAHFGELLDVLAAKGYEFVRVDELLAPPADEVFLRVNQVGFAPDDVKPGFAFSKVPLPEAFTVTDVTTQKPVFSGKTKPIIATWGQFTNHAELDFTQFKTPGKYVLCCGNAKSSPFTIVPQIYADLPDQLLEFMREQRCGYNPWLGTNCHQLDARTAYGPLTNGTTFDARGGWHDAGDLLKYLLTSGNATAQMLLAYEVSSNRASFADHVNALGQPGANGIPDVLDEARWGLDWMLKLHPAPDQLYHQVADDRDHYGWRLPPDEQADYGWGKGGARVVYFATGGPEGLKKYQSESTGVANLAGRYAAAMALAYQIWKDDPQQKEFAQRCLQAGREVYVMGRAKEGVQQGNSYLAKYRYAETTWADDMEWGATEMFRATGEAGFFADAKRYAKLAADESWMGQVQTGHYQYYPFMNAGHYRLYDLVDRHFQKNLAGYYRTGIERCMTMGKTNAYNIGVPFIWCSDNLTVALVTQCELYQRMTGDKKYQSFAAKQRDWLLGRNPWGRTMFTEIGSLSPGDVHLMTTQLTHRMVRGALVDGPVYDRIFLSLKGVAIHEPDPLAAFQGAAVYHDDVEDYSSNEPTMDGTASAILMFALEDK
ncbi:MAG TPA: glycoside hydrolase family 9 protein [Verrucomicrobiae bacterium]|nr:glycoside hydrolase family 9 protein [Verrucomicrobiae bacterium]